MSVAKALVRGVLIAGLLGSSARGGPLVLGLFSNQPAPVVPTAGFAPFVPSNPAPAQLGTWQVPSAPPTPAYSAPPAPAYSAPTYSAPTAPTSAPGYDAIINFGAGPYLNAGSLTTGNPLPWYTSGAVASFFGGTPTPQQQGDFDNAVIQRIGQAFRLSGIPISLTDDPTASANHTLSVVSNAVNGSNGQAIGMTYLGGNGFHYIDLSAQSAHSLDQLEWIVAHNISHELMLAFGVPEVHDQSGDYIDARSANWAMMVDPNARFSTDATADLLSRNFRARAVSPLLMGAQLLDSSPVPEPATLALWSMAAAAVAVARRARPRRIAT